MRNKTVPRMQCHTPVMKYENWVFQVRGVPKALQFFMLNSTEIEETRTI